MKLKSLVLVIFMMSLAGCGSDSDSDSGTQPVKPVDPSQPVKPVDPSQPVKPVDPSQPVKPVDPVEKVYSFEDLYEVSGYANVGAKLTVNNFKDAKFSSKLQLLESPDGANVKQSAIYSDYGIDLVFDKPGIYKFEYSESSLVKYIEVEVGESNIIKGPILKETLELSDTSKPYILADNLGIPKGVTLKVSKGVVLIGDNKEIAVEGILDITGDESSPVKIFDTIIKPVNDGGLIKIHHSYIEGGSVYAPTGSANHATLDLQKSLIKNVGSGISLWYPLGEVKIIGNHFINSGGVSFAIYQEEVTSLQILNNKFENWTSGYAIQNQTSYFNTEADLITDISYNSFIIDDKSNSYAAVLPEGYRFATMVMKNNYWGTTDVSKINAMIYDRNDSLESAGYIEFEPFLTKPHSDTPQ